MFNDSNWCKIIFAVMAFLCVVVSYFVRVFESITSVSQFGSALIRYGKLLDQKKAISLKNFQVPKSYNKLMYILAAWIYIPVAVYEIICVYFLNKDVSKWFMDILNICCGTNRHVKVSATHTTLAVCLYGLQVGRRFYDNQFISVYSKKAAISVLQFVFGLGYYLGAILIMIGESPKFANDHHLLSGRNVQFKFEELTFIDFLVTVIFLWAWYHQHVTTAILAALRKDEKGRIVSEGYKLPQGDWFYYLSSPHCIAEIIMYTCLWVMLGITHSWWCVFALVLTNQAESIISTHKWYQDKFEDFPRERRIFIPYVI